MKRRTFIKSIVGISSLLGISYSLWRGIRYPRISLEKPKLANEYSDDEIALQLADCMVCKNEQYFQQFETNNATIFLRAFAPEPQIEILGSTNGHTLVVNNISPDAVLNSSAPLTETKKGITRIIEIPATKTSISMEWKLSYPNGYQFASIGDSGGAEELEWCIQRAHTLGAHFFLHLGDFNYQASDYDFAINNFINAPIPCYVTIGNHDFRDVGNIVHKFLDDIGPLNNAFIIENTRFINLDTAASFLPVSGGQRATIMREIMADKHPYDDTVLFTHRPFYDPRPDQDHDLGNVFEKKWLVKSLKEAKIDTLIAGHIHSFFDTESEGIRIIISGQGLAHEDLIHKRQVAKLLMGSVTPGEKVDYDTEELAMPFELHCHPHTIKWRQGNDDPFAKKINELCEPIDSRLETEA